ncbi:hypothetical protein AU693_005023 [Salmonella enterica subsp. diarizonae]|nr:hypothetical protein [Salmonella enterica subsp. diarizonae]
MRLPEMWLIYAKWFVVWLVVLPMILYGVFRRVLFPIGLLAGGGCRVRSARPAGGLCATTYRPALALKMADIGSVIGGNCCGFPYGCSNSPEMCSGYRSTSDRYT